MTLKPIRKIILTGAALLIAAPAGMALAQNAGLNPDRDKPVEITAQGSLEWKRPERIFIANKQALATQGDTSIAAAQLTANYRDGKGSNMEIYRLTASDNVVVSSKESHAYGDKATYDLDKGVAVMTGNNLRMTAPDQTVTARDNFEYWVADGRLIANGDARIERLNAKRELDTLQSDKITALLKDNAQGQRVLHSMEAEGNVVITTPTEIVTGTHGTYNAETNKAILTGGVTIKRGPNILQGERAEVDMTTNTSKLFGGNEGGGRVRGVFYPGTEKKPDIQNSP